MIISSSPLSDKYQPGDFGYWWCVECGHEDIDGIEHDGNISVVDLNLTSLKGAPYSVKRSFDCSKNKLVSLKYAPQKVYGAFYCGGNILRSLKYCPSEIAGGFNCDNNQLTSLEYCPLDVGGYFAFSHNYISNLSYCPKSIKGELWATANPIKNLLKEIVDHKVSAYAYNFDKKYLPKDIENYQKRMEKLGEFDIKGIKF